MIRLPFSHSILAVAATATAATAQNDCASDAFASFLSRGPQSPVVVDSLETQSWREVFVFTYLTLEGPDLVGARAKKLIYAVLDADRPNCIIEAVSLGSYGADSTGEARRFHLDHYTFDAHVTLDFFDEAPERSDIEAIALSVLE